MPEANRNPQHFGVLAAQFNGDMFSKGRRAAPQVHYNVMYSAMGHAHQFSLWLNDLIMDPAQHILLGDGKVVLQPRGRQASFRHPGEIESLKESPAIITIYLRREYHDSGEWRSCNLHGAIAFEAKVGSRRMANRY